MELIDRFNVLICFDVKRCILKGVCCGKVMLETGVGQVVAISG